MITPDVTSFRPSLLRGLVVFLLALLLVPKLPAQNTIFSDNFENGLNGWLVGDGNVDGTPCYWGIVGLTFGGEGQYTDRRAHV